MMTNIDLFSKHCSQRGETVKTLAEKSGRSVARITAIVQGAECTNSEIIIFTSLLKLTKIERDQIFFCEGSPAQEVKE